MGKPHNVYPVFTFQKLDSVGSTPTRASVPGDVATTEGVDDPTQAAVPDTMAPAVGSVPPLDDGRAGPSTGVGVCSDAPHGSSGNVLEGDVSEGEMTAELSGRRVTAQHKPKDTRTRRINQKNQSNRS
ncbi:hypothetical protein E2C01_028525 [Portunus trituberculatus]|uniref:Uncharacterized protein n=1 Tax=Portunus trituberculatus TaxID=210409 RepID=A0A5B7EKW1_PORTR|nr:hypothetical protein [Portunus trituberculatus]